MKLTLTLPGKAVTVRLFAFFAIALMASLTSIGQAITVTNETFPNQFNTGFTAPAQNVSSGNFTGSTGTWYASSNNNATTVVLPAYYSPVTNAIKIVNWNTSGKTAGECHAASPKVNLSNYNCTAEMNLKFKLYTYMCNSTDATSYFKVEFSTDNGSTWTAVYTKSSKDIFNAWGTNNTTNISIAIPQSYRTANFKYRFSGYKPANSSKDFYLFVDDVKIMADNCPPACTGEISSVYFNKLDGGTDLPLVNGATYTTAQLASLYNFEAATTGAVGSIKFTVTGPTASTIIENSAPYNTPATGGGAWTGVPGNYTLNAKLYSASGATGSMCDEVTVNFTIIDNSCSCPGNIVQNPSFENGTANWTWSGGTLSAGTGAVKCGSKSGDFQITNTSNNWVSQTIGTDLPAGTVINASVYAGTHDATYYHQVAIEFFDANWEWISSSAVHVNKVLANAPVGPQLYTWSGTVPAGTKYTNVSFGGSGSWIKTDQWCVSMNIPDVGSIGDKVWNDVNRNGLQDASELGLAGVTVSLYNNSNVLIASTVTDAYGNYKFSGLPISQAGINYQVRFSTKPGYVYTTQNAGGSSITSATNSDANATTGRTANVTLTWANPSVTYVDAGLYLTQPNRIGDFIWNDLDKDGVQDAGEPGIAGVLVTLYNSSNVAVASTITDNNGHYEFNDVPAGTYTLGLTPPPGYQVSVKDAGGNDNTDSDFDPVTFRTGSVTVTTDVNLTIDGALNVTTEGKSSVGDFVFADLDNDNVQDPNEPGIAGVTVQLYNSANTLIATTTTNALGYYIFNNLDAGNYYVKFSNTPAGYVFVTADAGSNDNIDSDVTGANGTGTTATFTLAADENKTTVDAGMRRSSALNSLGDFVWYDLNKNGIQDAGEVGVPGVTVTLYNSTGGVVKTTITNTSGFYMFTDIAAGTYTVGYSNIPAGYAFSPMDAGGDAVDSDVNPATGRTAPVTITGNGNVITTVDAGLVSNPNIFDTKGSIGDFVWNDLNNNGLQDAGEPGIAGVTVTLYAANGTTVIATTTTDALGNYQFANLTAGDYVAGFSTLPSGYVFATANAGTDDTKDSDADAATGKTGIITLLPGQINTTVDAGARNPTALARLGNFIWNDVNGNGFQDAGEPGVPGVTADLLNDIGTVIKTTVSDANGFYMFTDLAAGTYRIQYSNLPAGFVATTKDATPANNNTDSDADATTLTTDNIVLAAGAADMSWDFGVRSTTTAAVGDYVWNDVNGNGLQDAAEAGVAGVLVTLYNSSNAAVASTVTDATGKYLFVNVTPGSYTMGFSNLPLGATFTTKDAGADATDSDVNIATGRTDAFTLAAGQSNMTIDAGLVTKYAAVGNYVWEDLNRNGIQDAGENPVAGVTVTLYNASNVAVASAVTDGNGYYFINNIPVTATANYTVGFGDTPSGLSFTEKNAAGSTADNNSDVNTATGRTDAFSLAAGQIRMDIDAGLVRPIKLTGNVWHDVNGMADNLVNNSGAAQVPVAASIPANLRAYLVNFSTGLVEQVAVINPMTGIYTFNDVSANTNYYVLISTAFGVIGQVPPASVLPTGWIHTGQKLGTSSGSDGLNDGRLVVPVVNSDVDNANFGIKLAGTDVVTG